MKVYKKIALSVLALQSFVLATNAQKQFSEGVLTYNISVVSGGNEAQLPPGFENAKMVVYLKPQQSRNEFSTSLGSETNVFDSKAGKGFILKEFGTKLMITLDKPDWDQIALKNRNIKFSISDNYFNIAGTNCKKATATLESGKEMVIYFNPELVPVNKTYHNAFPQIPGVPVQFEIQSGNITFRYTLASIEESAVPAAKFNAPQSGYRVMTFAENQQLRKGTGK